MHGQQNIKKKKRKVPIRPVFPGTVPSLKEICLVSRELSYGTPKCPALSCGRCVRIIHQWLASSLFVVFDFVRVGGSRHSVGNVGSVV